MRCEERSADCGGLAAARRRASSASSSRLASTLVSGVRSSCEASATNSRWRSQHRLGLVARRRRALRASRPACAPARRPRRRRPASGPARVGVARAARSRARWRSARRSGAIARRASIEPGEQREAGAAEHAEQQEEAHAADRRVEVGDAAGRTGRRPADRLAGRRASVESGLDAVAADACGCPSTGKPRSGAPRASWRSDVAAVASSDRAIAAFSARGVGLEVRPRRAARAAVGVDRRLTIWRAQLGPTASRDAGRWKSSRMRPCVSCADGDRRSAQRITKRQHRRGAGEPPADRRGRSS